MFCKLKLASISTVVAVSFLSVPAAAVVPPDSLPSSVDSGRVGGLDNKLPLSDSIPSDINVNNQAPSLDIPEEAKSIKFVLNDVNIQGATAINKDELNKVYANYIGREITLDVIYEIAQKITYLYREKGYFLSLANVPEQSIENGEVTIRVVEGYIGKVEFEDDLAENHVIKDYVEALRKKRPIKIEELESFLLRLNSLPGCNFRAVLSTIDGGIEGAMLLTLKQKETAGSGYINIDNYGSRFLGPHEVSVSYTDSILPLQSYTIAGLTSLPTDELKFATIGYDMVVASDLTVQFSGGITQAYPGYNLEIFDIDSQSKSLSLKMNYQIVKQRRENLAVAFGIDSRNTNTDVLNTKFTRDRIRAARASLVYDMTDDWNGYNIANVTLSHGLDIFGASQEGELTLSRDEASPDFNKLEVSFLRLQAIDEDWSMLASVAGQYASGALFSSEEFGYGGQAFGRAYDASEITGDHGIEATFELRYAGIPDIMDEVSLVPYAFYDTGVVWNEDTGQDSVDKASSAGFGSRAKVGNGFLANVGMAWPLTRQAANPIYGATSSSPRLLLQLTQQF